MKSAESVSANDTYEGMQECFAVCLSKVQDALGSETEDEIKRQRVYLALSDCYTELQTLTGTHFAFMEKAESVMDKLKKKAMEMQEKLFTNKGKESIMDEKQKAEFAEQQAEFNRQKAEFAEQQTALKSEQDKIDAQKAEFAEKARIEAEQAIDTAVAEFKEDLVKKNYPVKKMEEQGVFVLAKNLLKQEEIEFSEGDKQVKSKPIDVLKSLVENFSPVATGTEFEEQQKIVSAGELAKEYGITGSIDLEGMQKLQFVEAYISKFGDNVAGKTKSEKRLTVQTQINMGQLKVDPSVLQ